MDDSDLPRALPLLAGTSNKAADYAIIEALPHMDADAAEAAVDILVRRKQAAVLAMLVSRFHDYREPLRKILATRAEGLHHGVHACAGSSAFDKRASAIEFIVAANDTKSAHLLADALRARRGRMREIAAAALYELVAARTDENAPHESRATSPDGPQNGRAVAQAVCGALRTWELHHQRKIVEAALLLGDSTDAALRKTLADPRSRLRGAVAGILQGAPNPRIAGALLRSLAIEPVRTAAVRAITRAGEQDLIDAVLKHAWLLTDPSVERGCHRIRDGEWSQFWLSRLAALEEHRLPGGVAFVAALGGTTEQRMQRFRSLLEMNRPALSRAVLWRLVDDESDEATELLANLASRSDDSLAEVATRECRRRRPPHAAGRPLAPHDEAASPPAAVEAVHRFVEDFDRLAPQERTTLADRLRGLTVDVEPPLRAAVTSADAPTRSKGLRAAVALRCVERLADAIHASAHDRSPRVRAVAMSVLSHLPGPTTHRILQQAVHDPDDRVQADAIEAMEKLGIDRCANVIEPKLESQNSRVRANAVKALMRVEMHQAAEALLDMLDDPTQSHRLSALWVVQRLQLRTLVDRIAHLSRHDQDERVRNRARRVLQTLIKQVPPQHETPPAVSSPAAPGGSL